MLHLGDIKGAGSGARSRRPEAVAALDWPARFAALAEAAQEPRLRAFYAAGAVAGDTPLAEVPMVAIDVETTGLDPARDEIVSIGLLPMTLKCIASSASRYWVVRPRIDLNPESVVIHAITHAQIEAAPDLGAVIDELLAALAGPPPGVDRVLFAPLRWWAVTSPFGPNPPRGRFGRSTSSIKEASRAHLQSQSL